MEYYNEIADFQARGRPRNTIRISSVLSIERACGNNNEVMFNIKTRDRVHQFIAGNANELQEWVMRVRSLLNSGRPAVHLPNSAKGGIASASPDFPWLYGTLTREEAEKYLVPHINHDGLFIIRKSSRYDLTWVVSFIWHGNMKHFLATQKSVDGNNMFNINNRLVPCSTLRALVTYLLSKHYAWRTPLTAYVHNKTGKIVAIKPKGAQQRPSISRSSISTSKANATQARTSVPDQPTSITSNNTDDYSEDNVSGIEYEVAEDYTPDPSNLEKLAISMGDIVRVYKQQNGWSLAVKSSTGGEGWVPTDFLEPIQSPPPRPPPAIVTPAKPKPDRPPRPSKQTASASNRVSYVEPVDTVNNDDTPPRPPRQKYDEPQAADDPRKLAPRVDAGAPPDRPPKNGYVVEDLESVRRVTSAPTDYEDIGFVAPVEVTDEPCQYVVMNPSTLAEAVEMGLASDAESDADIAESGNEIDEHATYTDIDPNMFMDGVDAGPAPFAQREELDPPPTGPRTASMSSISPSIRQSSVSISGKQIGAEPDNLRGGSVSVSVKPSGAEFDDVDEIAPEVSDVAPTETPPQAKSRTKFFLKRADKKKNKRKEVSTPPDNRRVTRHDNIPVREMSNMDLITLMGMVKDNELTQDEAVRHRELYVQGLVDNPLPEKKVRAPAPEPTAHDASDDEINQLLGDIDNNVQATADRSLVAEFKAKHLGGSPSSS